jgi:hypothetical protein
MSKPTALTISPITWSLLHAAKRSAILSCVQTSVISLLGTIVKNVTDAA